MRRAWRVPRLRGRAGGSLAEGYRASNRPGRRLTAARRRPSASSAGSTAPTRGTSGWVQPSWFLAFAHAQRVTTARLAGESRRPGFSCRGEAECVDVAVQLEDAELGLVVLDPGLVHDVDLLGLPGRVDLE